MVSGNTDFSPGPVPGPLPCDRRVPIPESKVSSDQLLLLLFQLRSVAFADKLVRTGELWSWFFICASVFHNDRSNVVFVFVPDHECLPLLPLLPWQSAHPSVSCPVPGQSHEVGETPPRFLPFHPRPGPLRSTLYHSLHRSTTTTLVGSPSLPPPPPTQEWNPRSRALNCNGEWADKQHNSTFQTFIIITICPADGSIIIPS